MNLCQTCGKNLDLVGRMHLCVPKYRPEFVREVLEADRGPIEAKFDNLPDMMKWLDEPKGKLGRPRIGEVRGKPWEALGMSRATWYRRRRETPKTNPFD